MFPCEPNVPVLMLNSFPHCLMNGDERNGLSDGIFHVNAEQSGKNDHEIVHLSVTVMRIIR